MQSVVFGWLWKIEEEKWNFSVDLLITDSNSLDVNVQEISIDIEDRLDGQFMLDLLSQRIELEFQEMGNSNATEYYTCIITSF